MNSRSSNLFRFSFAIFDLLCLNMVHLLLILVLPNVLLSKHYAALFVTNNAIWIMCAYITALYVGKHHTYDNFFKRSVLAFLVFTGVSLLFIFLVKYDYSRLFVILTFSGFCAVILISRTLYVGAAYYLRKQSPLNRKVIVIGYNDLSKKLVENFSKYNRSISVLGYFEDEYFDDDHGTPVMNRAPVLGTIEQSVEYAIENQVSEIYSTVAPERNAHIYDLAQYAEANFIRFKFVPDFRIFINRHVHIDFARNIPILSLRPEPLDSLDSQMKKRFFDLAFSVFIIFFLLSWMVPLIALLIKLDSKGPVFFTQPRSGRNNQPFMCYKFRSLHVNDEAHEQQVTRNDKRFTKVGKFLRKTNLDEFPQFLNVFRGEMSIVGPRPHMLKHTEEYSQMLNHFMVRHYVKPGVTGWAQINGHRGEIRSKKDLRLRVEHDIWYMENWSMWLDLRIIMLTVYNTFRGDENAI